MQAKHLDLAIVVLKLRMKRLIQSEDLIDGVMWQVGNDEIGNKAPNNIGCMTVEKIIYGDKTQWVWETKAKL